MSRIVCIYVHHDTLYNVHPMRIQYKVQCTLCRYSTCAYAVCTVRDIVYVYKYEHLLTAFVWKVWDPVVSISFCRIRRHKKRGSRSLI